MMRTMTVRKLQENMENMDSERFKQFKAYIRQNCSTFPCAPLDKLKETPRYKAFHENALEEFPELGAYEGHWPIEAYVKLHLTRDRSRRSSGLSNTTATAAGQTLSDVDGSLSTPKSTRVFIGKTPPRRHGKKHIVSNHNNALPAVNDLRQVPGSPSGISAFRTRLLGAGCTPILSSRSGFSISAGQSRTSAPAIYPVGCLECGHRPIAHPDSTREINAISNGNNSMTSVLAALGIVSDHHMHLFRKWGTASFVDSLPFHILSPLYKTVLIKYLLQGRKTCEPEDDHPLMPVPVQQNPQSFQQPSLDLERYLINASVSAIRDAMGLANNTECFKHVINTIDNCMNELPTTEASDGRTLVNKICSKCPLLQSYQNSWPITIYIKWRRQRLCSRRLPGQSQDGAHEAECIGDLATAESLQSTEGSEPPLKVPSSGCEIHGLPSDAEACPKLRKVLHTFGMQELLAIFLAVGIRSDKDFDLFRNLDIGDKLSMFENLASYNLRLNLFQEMMLRRMIEHPIGI